MTEETSWFGGLSEGAQVRIQEALTTALGRIFSPTAKEGLGDLIIEITDEVLPAIGKELGPATNEMIREYADALGFTFTPFANADDDMDGDGEMVFTSAMASEDEYLPKSIAFKDIVEVMAESVIGGFGSKRSDLARERVAKRLRDLADMVERREIAPEG